MRVTNVKAFHYAIFSSFLALNLGPKYLPEHPNLEHPQVMFLPQCDRPSFTPIQKQCYNSIYINIYVLSQQTGRKNVTDRMAASVPGIKSAPNFSMHAILNC
jgi:hypothetical protein